MGNDVVLVLVGAGIALVSSLLTLVVGELLWRRRASDLVTRAGSADLGQWTSGYVQALREAAGKREAGEGEKPG